MRLQALDAEVEAHAVLVGAHDGQTGDADDFCTRPRQLESHARRESLLEEGGEGAAKGFERGHGRGILRLLSTPARACDSVDP